MLLFWITATILMLLGTSAFADNGHPGHESFLSEILIFLAIAGLAHLVGGKLERLGQSAVIGYLLVGIALGNLPVTAEWMKLPLIERAELGGVLTLMFLVGLETHLGRMKDSGWPALKVATVGVLTPMFLTIWLMPLIDPGKPVIMYWWYAAATAATSVGITSAILRDLGLLKLQMGLIIIGAAVLDDVMGLGVLSVVSSVAKEGKIDGLAVGMIIAKAVGFLVGSIVIGVKLADPLSRFFSKKLRLARSNGKLIFALGFGATFAWLATLFGLEPIIGAFAGGLVLNDVHFEHFESGREVEDLIKPWSYILMPIFFMATGAKVPLPALGNPAIWAIIPALTGIAFIGKLACGLTVVRELGKRCALATGIGMVPRGEVGIVFGNLGLTLGVIGNGEFATILAMVLITTLTGPPLLKWVLREYSTLTATEVQLPASDPIYPNGHCTEKKKNLVGTAD